MRRHNKADTARGQWRGDLRSFSERIFVHLSRGFCTDIIVFLVLTNSSNFRRIPDGVILRPPETKQEPKREPSMKKKKKETKNPRLLIVSESVSTVTTFSYLPLRITFLTALVDVTRRDRESNNQSTTMVSIVMAGEQVRQKLTSMRTWQKKRGTTERPNRTIDGSTNTYPDRIGLGSFGGRVERTQGLKNIHNK